MHGAASENSEPMTFRPVDIGQDLRLTIGSVNLAEFFLSFVSAGVFAMLLTKSS